MSSEPTISVVVPVYNSADTLSRLVEVTRTSLEGLDLTYEIVLVDDASADGSWEAIRRLKAEHGDRLRAISLAWNSGQQAATLCGLMEARGDWVVTLDDDLQADPSDIGRLLEVARETGADLVYGTFGKLRHGWLHNLGTRLFRTLMRRVAPGFPDGSSFRLIRGTVLDGLAGYLGPWVFIDPVLAWRTSRIASVPVEHHRGQSGRSRYSIGSLVSIATTLLLTYSRLPLRLMTGLGLLSAIVSLGLGIYFLVQRLTVGAQVGFSALIVTISFSSGLILLSLGVLGEYVSRIHTMLSGRPAFTIKATL